MSNVFPFPPKDSKALRESLANVRQTYLKAGLSNEAAEAALEEFWPILEQFIKGRREFVMEFPSTHGFTTGQAQAIEAAHNKCVQEILDSYREDLGLALNTIAGLIGRQQIP